jgi:hypothetical protein
MITTKYKNLWKAAPACLLLLGLSQPASATIATFSTTQNFSLDNLGLSAAQPGNTSFSESNTETGALAFDRFTFNLVGPNGGYLSDVRVTYQSIFRHQGAAGAEDTRCDGFFPCIFGNGWRDDAEVTANLSAMWDITLADPATQNVSASDSSVLNCDSNGDRKRACQDLYDSGTQVSSGAFDLSGFTLADFEGTSPIAFELSNITAFNGSCDRIGGDSDSEIRCQIANGATWGGSVTVEYDYAVPTPATLSLFGLALVGLGLSRKRKMA